MSARYHAVVFDLLTALLDSWTLWNTAAGSPELGLRWRRRYLELTYGSAHYVPYEALVRDAARDVGLELSAASDLIDRWATLSPWPEAPRVLTTLAERRPVGVVTNCSEHLGQVAADLLRVPLSVVITAERAGHYKPHPRAYALALASLGMQPSEVLYVAGSPYDLHGASAVGMDVVWHNRIGLAPLPHAPRPVAEIATLDELLQLV